MKTIVVNRHFEPYDIYIGRGTKWGNPFVIGRDGNREEVIELYRKYAANNPEIISSLYELRGKRLGCSCKPQLCHGDVLIEMLEEKRYKRLVIGIDQSYTRTGISLAADGKLLKVSSVDFKGCKTKTEKRKHIALVVDKILRINKHKARRTVVLCERIRTI